MPLWSIWLTGLGMSADVFAALFINGVKMDRFNYRHALVVIPTLAGFQATTSLLGWPLAVDLTSLPDPFDYWIAFVLLAIIGGKTVWEAFQVDENEDDDSQRSRLDPCRLLTLGAAISTGAAAVGVFFVMPEIPILLAILCIGLITLVASFAMVGIGCRTGAKFRRSIEFLGGVVLTIIGVRTLLEGLGLL